MMLVAGLGWALFSTVHQSGEMVILINNNKDENQYYKLTLTLYYIESKTYFCVTVCLGLFHYYLHLYFINFVG